MLGALEAGGTKMVCSTGDAQGQIFSTVSFPTATPEETMPQIIAYFRDQGVEALGVGSFGPVDLRPTSPTYGYITSTPKLPWRFYPLLQTLRDSLSIPIGFGTDVGLAAIGEHSLGAAAGLDSCIYVTVGTGVGAGIIVDNELVQGLVHPEFGHFWLRPHPDDPSPHGFCPYHDGCVEGLANGPSIEKRWGQKAHLLPPEHPAWELERYYLAQMCMTAIVVLSPERIILGGGVMQQTHLFPGIRKHVQEMLGDYVQHRAILEEIDTYIVPPGLGGNSGVTGALLLAARAAEGQEG
ncbi:ROK family protein [Eubacteriales bacterium OttesenSCG-928-A19]|nr:ROK family protein [Eubacteriales bacterium OttesenSCG-928-A19]